MSTFRDLLESILDSSRERIKSPIIGTFIISFCIYNWKPIIFLFASNASIEDKFIVINHEYCNVWEFIIPIIMTFVYIAIFPFVNLRLDKSLKDVNESRLIEKHEVSISKLKKKAEIAAQERIVEAERAGTEDITNLKNEIDLLRNEKQSLTENYNSERQQLNTQLETLLETVKNSTESLGEIKTNLTDSVNKYNELRKYISRIYVDKLILPEEELFLFTLVILPDFELEYLFELDEKNEKKTLEKFSSLSSQLMKKAGLLKNNFEGTYSISDRGWAVINRLKTR